MVALLAVGAAALLIYAVIYILGALRMPRLTIGATFSRIYALIVVAVLAVGLGFSGLGSTAQTAGFTLLGTVAGYLATVQTKTTGGAAGTTGDASTLPTSPVPAPVPAPGGVPVPSPEPQNLNIQPGETQTFL
jgi:hypothetical protein